MSFIASFLTYASQLKSLSSGSNVSEIAVNLERLSAATQEIANAIIDVKKYGRSIEAEGCMKRASISLKATVLDDAKKELDKAKGLDPSNWAVWVGYVWLFTLINNRSCNSNKYSFKDNEEFHICLEKAIRYTKSSTLIPRKSKILILNSLVTIAYLSPDEKIQQISLISFIEILIEEESLNFEEFYKISINLKKIVEEKGVTIPNDLLVKKNAKLLNRVVAQ